MLWLLAIIALASAAVTAYRLRERLRPPLSASWGYLRSLFVVGGSLELEARSAQVVASVLPKIGPDLLGAGSVDLFLGPDEWRAVAPHRHAFQEGVLALLGALGAEPGRVELWIFPGADPGVSASEHIRTARVTKSSRGPLVSPPDEGGAELERVDPSATIRFPRGEEDTLRPGDGRIIGSDPPGALDLKVTGDDEVSARHLAITFDGARFLLTDLDSTNGVFVNGKRLHHCSLEEGDSVTFGRSQFVVQLLVRSGDRRRIVGGGPVPPLPVEDRSGATQALDSPELGEDAEEVEDPGEGASADAGALAGGPHHGSESTGCEPQPQLEPLPQAPPMPVPASAGVVLLRPVASRATLPLREAIQAPILGRTSSGPLRWAIAGEVTGNLNMVVWGASGAGKSQFTGAVIAQLPERVGLLIADLKGEYSTMALPAIGHHDMWHDGLPFNPLAPPPGADPRSVEAVEIAVRDALEQASRRRSRLGNRQLTRLGACVRHVVSEGGTMADLGVLLDDDLRAVFGDLTDRGLFRDGPPLGALLDERAVLDLGSLPGDGRTGEYAVSLVLVGLLEQLTLEPEAPHALRTLVVTDEAHRIASQRALELLARQGRSRGLGTVLVTQGPADLPEDVVDQAGTLVCFRLPPKQAQMAAELLGGGDALATTIQRLPAGMAVIKQGALEPVKVSTVQHRELASSEWEEVG